MLEGRLVPTTNVWLATISTDATVGANWSLGHYPTPTEGVSFDGGHNYPCWNFGGPVDPDPMGNMSGQPLAYPSVTLGNGYTSTVHMSGGILIHNFVMQSGNLDPTANASSPLGILDTWSWTGGTINSTDQGDAINLWEGATATVNPGLTGSVTTGSSINLLDPDDGGGESTITFHSGTTNFLNGAGVNIGNLCAANLAPVPGGTLSISASGVSLTDRRGHWTINAGGTLTAKTLGGTTLDSQLPIDNMGGTLEITGSGTLSVPADPNDDPSWSVFQAGGKTILWDGATLEVEDGMRMDAGTLVTKDYWYGWGNIDYDVEMQVNAGGTNYRIGYGLATIDGSLTVFGGDIILHEGKPRRCMWGDPENVGQLHSGNVFGTVVFGELKVKGDVYWYGGTYRPVVWGAVAEVNGTDLWSCEGTFHIDCDAEIAPGSVSLNGTLNVAPTAGYKRWRVIEADEEIIAGQGTPSVDATWCSLRPLEAVTPKTVYIETPFP